VSVTEHYARTASTDADQDSESNVGVRNSGAERAAGGPALDDFLLTRTIEIAVHNDDLAVSVGVPAPALPAYALDLVLPTLVQVAARRHGGTALLRVLSRAERARGSVCAF
jgi:hypothetical protein